MWLFDGGGGCVVTFYGIILTVEVAVVTLAVVLIWVLEVVMVATLAVAVVMVSVVVGVVRLILIAVALAFRGDDKDDVRKDQKKRTDFVLIHSSSRFFFSVSPPRTRAEPTASLSTELHDRFTVAQPGKGRLSCNRSCCVVPSKSF